MKQNEKASEWGLFSTDGFFQPFSALSVEQLEYASKPLAELQTLLAENIQLEYYEKCAILRDEIIKRISKS